MKRTIFPRTFLELFNSIRIMNLRCIHVNHGRGNLSVFFSNFLDFCSCSYLGDKADGEHDRKRGVDDQDDSSWAHHLRHLSHHPLHQWVRISLQWLMQSLRYHGHQFNSRRTVCMFHPCSRTDNTILTLSRSSTTPTLLTLSTFKI